MSGARVLIINGGAVGDTLLMAVLGQWGIESGWGGVDIMGHAERIAPLVSRGVFGRGYDIDTLAGA